MKLRAKDGNIMPHEFLALLAVDPDVEIDDYIPQAGKLIPIKRKLTITERIDCAKHSAPYYYAKKASAVEHSGNVKIEFSLPSTALDTTTLDEQGRVIDAEDIEFDDMP